MTDAAPPVGRYTPLTVFEVEGARVGLVSCLRCGAAVLIDPRDQEAMALLHDQWHELGVSR